MDIKNFLEKLSTYTKVDFTGNESEMGLLAQKYDKNKNSIFEKDELQEIKDDLIFHARKTGSRTDLNGEEAQSFIESILPDSVALSDMAEQIKDNAEKFVEGLLNNLFDIEKQNILNIVEKSIAESGGKREISESNLELLCDIPSDVLQKAIERKLFFVENREKQFGIYEIKDFAKLSEDEFERIKTLFNVENRQEQFSGWELLEFAELSEEEFERAKTLFHVENREEQFDVDDILHLAKLSEDAFERAKSLFHVENREEQFSGRDISYLAELSYEQFERAKTLFYVENREEQFDGYKIYELSKYLSKEQFERAKTLFHVENREEQLLSYEIKDLAQLSAEQLERAKTLFYVENREEQFSIGEITMIAALLSEEEFERAKTLFYIENREEQFSAYAIEDLARLSKEEFKRAKTLFHVENREKQFAGGEIAKLAKLSPKELKRAKTLFHVENREEQIDVDNIIKLAKYDNSRLKQISKYIKNNNMPAEYLADIAEYYSKDLEEFLDSHINTCTFKKPCENSLILFDNNKYYLFGKDGLTNIIKQEVDGTTDDFTFNEKLTYFDKKENVTKTVTIKTNPQSGALNVSETDRNGNQMPIQWQSIDQDTGANITERHLTSPEGAKTDYYAEESDNLKITDYKITDKDGNTLINVHQTFEKISDNKFISSINTTEDQQNAQIYEIEYLNNNVVKIFDKKNNKTTEINLNDYFNDDESLNKIIPIIKQLPGQVLLKFAENPLRFLYYERYSPNGSWDYSGSTELTIKNFDGNADCNIEIMTHELGHYIDIYISTDGIISSNKEILSLFNEELKEFQENAIPQQQKYIDYFIHTYGDGGNGPWERVAETHSILYSTEGPHRNLRRLYLAQYFPRTMAAIMKLLLEEEGVQ